MPYLVAIMIVIVCAGSHGDVLVRCPGDRVAHCGDQVLPRVIRHVRKKRYFASEEFLGKKAAITSVVAEHNEVADYVSESAAVRAFSSVPRPAASRLIWRRRVGEIRHSEVQSWLTAFTKDSGKPRSATTVLRAYGVLAGILDTAVKDRRILSNPARGVNLPRKLKGKHKYLTHEQVELLADNAKKHRTLVLFLAYTGLRWGEATALRVRDVDLERRRVDVHENAVEVSGTIHVGTPKTGEARSVPFPPFLSPLLSALTENKSSDQLVFGDGLTYLHQPDRRRGWYVGAIARSQTADPEFPRVTIHDLRHTAASLAISAGANVKAVQRMLGHSSAAMTLDTYADLFDDDLDAVAIALDAARANSNVVKM